MIDALGRTLTRRATLCAVLLAVITTIIAVLAARRQSATFDETFLVASGVRGFATGEFVLAADHPPAMQYLYGLPVYLSNPVLPPEPGWDMTNRFIYTRQLWFEMGNDPERLAFLSRMVAALIAGALVFAVFAYTAPRAGSAAGLIAALLIGFTPDVLGHGGVAYNDVPLVLAIFLAVWAIDRAVREPRLTRVALAAFTIGVALSVKFSALVLGPIALVMLAMEGIGRGAEGAWWRRVGLGIPVAVIVFYLTLVLANRGDITLDLYRRGMAWALFHSGKGHSVPAYLLGERNEDGFWYFYPLLFLFKTPVALHLLMAIAAGAGIIALRDRMRAARASGTRWWRDYLSGPYRAMTVTVIVFGWVLITAKLNLGLRHGLPIVPPLLVLTAVGTVAFVRRHPPLRKVTGLLVALMIASSMAQYPNFLSYTSEYVVDRQKADHLFADSSLDWGQGLIQLREWMQENDVDRVYLSYFGSAIPAAYGIDYIAMRSYFLMFTPMDSTRIAQPQPRWTVISATNRAGVYFEDDPFAGYREIRPAHVIGNHLYVYPAQ